MFTSGHIIIYLFPLLRARRLLAACECASERLLEADSAIYRRCSLPFLSTLLRAFSSVS